MGMGKKNCRDKIYPDNPFDFHLYFLTQGFSLGNPDEPETQLFCHCFSQG